MIVVFVVDTSPSMGDHLKLGAEKNNRSGSGMSKLDLAKMTVESIVKMMEKRIMDHNTRFQQQQQSPSYFGGTGYCIPDQFLLLSTGSQNLDTNNNNTGKHKNKSTSTSSICGAGGRLLVGFGEYNEKDQSQQHQQGGGNGQNHQQYFFPQHQKHDAFEKELKSLTATTWVNNNAYSRMPFPEDGGGAEGLNISLSTGLQLLSRYRLHYTTTENFGMGRLPTNQNLIPNNIRGINVCSSASGSIIGGRIGVGVGVGAPGGKQSPPPGTLIQAGNALQPACLILLTDGECLKRPRNQGGGTLQMQFNLPLRELYRERIGANDSLHPSLRAFCDVTGGHHATVQNVSNITPLTELLARLIAPQIPSEWPLSNPLQLPHLTPPIISKPSNRNDENRNIFVNAGPICSFQQFESTPTGPASPIHRAMLLYTPTMNITNDSTTTKTTQPQPPIWCIPEMYFPSKKLDTLPPRSAQPILNFVRQYQDAGMNTFDPLHIMKLLHRLEQVVSSNRNIVHGNNTKPLLQIFQCDVYMCQWLNQSEGEIHYPKTQKGQEHFPVCVRDAGRSLCEGDENVLNIGILHVPHNTPIKGKHSTLTLMPPDAHILLPLLLKVAEVENRALKKALEKRSSMDNEQAKKNLLAISRNILIDENWYSEFRAYLFRLPPYYMFSIKRCLHQLLPSRCQALVSIESVGSVVSQCFSKQCLQKIKHGEQISRENIDRLERKEEEYRNNILDIQDNKGGEESGYGHFDKRSQTSNYLNALRQMPPPWKLGSKKRPRSDSTEQRNSASKSATDRILNLPHECLLAYYECRRRWIFGGSGLTTKGLAVDGVNNCGSNVHRFKKDRNLMDESLLSFADVGASTIETTPISKMGEFKGRLLYSKQSIVGYGCNDSTISATTTAADGSPNWSMGDEALPLGFFDPKTAEFNDSIENRVRAKLMINFGNPFKDKRGDSIIPELYSGQRPPLRTNMSKVDISQGSPPHDTFSSSIEGEGEAVFVRTSPTHTTNYEADVERDDNSNPAKRQRIRPPIPQKKPPPPPLPAKLKAGNNKSKPPPPSKPKQGHPPPPPPKAKLVNRKPSLKQIPPPPIQNVSPNNPTNSSNGNLSSQNKASNQMEKNPEVQSPDEKPKVNLPPGWISVWSKSQRRWYFFDQRTNKSVWQWPPPP